MNQNPENMLAQKRLGALEEAMEDAPQMVFSTRQFRVYVFRTLATIMLITATKYQQPRFMTHMGFPSVRRCDSLPSKHGGCDHTNGLVGARAEGGGFEGEGCLGGAARAGDRAGAGGGRSQDLRRELRDGSANAA